MSKNESQKRSLPSANPRPYRSHKFPACDFCRRRKARCSRPVEDGPCQLCRLHRLECTQAGTARLHQTAKTLPKTSVLRPSESPWIGTSDHVSGYSNETRAFLLNDGADDHPYQQGAGVHLTGKVEKVIHEPNFASSTLGSQTEDTLKCGITDNQESHVISPALARDMQLLGGCLSPDAPANARSCSLKTFRNAYNVVSDDPRDPIVHHSVPRHRNTSHEASGQTGFRQCETIERIIDPLGRDLFDLYFKNFHLSFPILDEESTVEAYCQQKLPYVLVCEIYTVSLVSWNLSPAISKSGRSRPDIEYLWNQTVSALREDFASPGFSTVLSCILDLTGRPTTSILYNSINVGKCVALAKSLGLNRDPTDWGLQPQQKDLRVRAWWGVLIHDWWSSLSHGTPPHIQLSQFDVKVPELNSLRSDKRNPMRLSGNSHSRDAGARTFLALCQLTKILGNLLPLVYDNKPKEAASPMRSLLKLEANLEAWESVLPSWLNPACPVFQPESPGALNLQLCCLAVKLSLYRVCLLETSKWDGPESLNLQRLYQSRCRSIATAISEFVVMLEDKDLAVFWLPYAAYHFTSATTMLLRCALETDSNIGSRECVNSARKMIRHLRKLKNDASWDLADHCLHQCEDAVRRLSEDAYLELQRNQLRGSRITCEASLIQGSQPEGVDSRAVSVEFREEALAHKSAFNLLNEALLPDIPLSQLDPAMFEATQNGPWYGNWDVPGLDTWLVPGYEEGTDMVL